jgi:hypothetical protein
MKLHKLRWPDGPKDCGPYKTPCSQWKRWDAAGVAKAGAEPKTVVI